MSKYRKDENPISREDVLEDMQKGGPMAAGARSYYYINYASKEERMRMDQEDRDRSIGEICTYLMDAVSMIALAVVFSVQGWFRRLRQGGDLHE